MFDERFWGQSVIAEVGTARNHSRANIAGTTNRERATRTNALDAKGGCSISTCRKPESSTKRFDDFVRVFNYERPREALQMKTPASVYAGGKKRLDRTPPKVAYGRDYIIRGVRRNGTILFGGREIFITEVLRGQNLGLRETDPDR